jgi:hypothetical protein
MLRLASIDRWAPARSSKNGTQLLGDRAGHDAALDVAAQCKRKILLHIAFNANKNRITFLHSYREVFFFQGAPGEHARIGKAVSGSRTLSTV